MRLLTCTFQLVEMVAKLRTTERTNLIRSIYVRQAAPMQHYETSEVAIDEGICQLEGMQTEPKLDQNRKVRVAWQGLNFCL
jgi:hypothetical protein